ncbi:MAG: hypothetical protein GY804_15440 [Alphaproteobacteria bacterium]|nr:hypothetical protein [Alphaproteobacteria bacterium]
MDKIEKIIRKYVADESTFTGHILIKCEHIHKLVAELKATNDSKPDLDELIKKLRESRGGCENSLFYNKGIEYAINLIKNHEATNDSTAIELLRRCQDVLLLDINKNAMTSLKKEIAEYLVDL